MGGKIRTKDKTLDVQLFDNGLVEIESSKFKNVAVEVKVVDPTDPLTPPGALYRIQIYKSEPNAKSKPFEYDTGWVMSDGKIVKRGEEYRKAMAVKYGNAV